MSVRKLGGVIVAAALTITFGAGCAEKSDLDLAVVTGTVTLDDKPLDHGTVYFIPDNKKGTQGPMSIAEIDKDGNFTIQSAGDQKGAVVGFHQIRVECRKPPKDIRDTEPESLIPKRYDDPRTSGLTAEVVAGENNVVNLKLTSTPDKKGSQHPR